MLFLDCSQWCEDNRVSIDRLEEAGVEVGVMWQDGRMFNSPYSIRMNLALPYSKVVQAFERLDEYVFNKK